MIGGLTLERVTDVTIGGSIWESNECYDWLIDCIVESNDHYDWGLK